MALFRKILRHKLASGIILLLVIAGAYFGYTKFFNNDDVIRYLTARVQKGILIVSISGSGQVSVSNQVEIKPKVSGEVVRVDVENGQEVKAGTLLAQIDSRDVQKTVRDAKANLKSAQLALEKIKKPADELSILQAENPLKQVERELEELLKPPDELDLLEADNSLLEAKDNLTKLKLSQQISYQKTLEAKQKAEDDLKKAFEDGFNAVANTFLSLPTVMEGIQSILFDYTLDRNRQNIDWYVNQTVGQNDEYKKALQSRDDVYKIYNKARPAYTKNLDSYKSSSRSSDTPIIESLILETYETTKIIADTVKTANNYIDFVQDFMKQRNLTIPALVSTHQSNLDSYTGVTNSHLVSLLSIKRTIQTSKETITNADRDIQEMNQNHPIELRAVEQTIKEKESSLVKLKAGADQATIQTAKEKIEEKRESLEKLKKGPDALDIQSSELTVKQRENALLDAQEKLDDYFVRTPFDGIIAKLDVKKSDSVSPATVLVTFITKQKIAEISLNEVDVTKVKVGQKATLTFDAIPDLTITGQVAEVDTVGTVSQGVVTYTVKIGFNTQDERVKPGMSVSAAIVTDAKPNVLLVPNSAVKSQGGMSYVEMLDGDNAILAAANPNGAIFKNPPRRQPIEVGIANDEFTEIVNGLKEGDVIVTRTIQPNSPQSQTSSQQGGFRIPGLPGRGGGMRR